ncbi:MAG TPA: DUF2752 domain-containing protein [Gemmataceae bacterium]
MPASSIEPRSEYPAVRRRRLSAGVRLALVGVAAGLAGVFALAARVEPYDAAGRPLREGTHEQLGLPPCNFYRMTGRPCPSCGMTTSFALLVRGDVEGSLRANWVGTLGALFAAGLLPWSAVSALRGRYLWLRSVEWAVLAVLGGFAVLMMLRWGWIMAVAALPV